MTRLPVRGIALGYLVLVVVGALALRLTARAPLSMGEALFTATSALTVTGLTVVNTAEHFTPEGHLVLLLLIQVGGLGWITLALGAAAGLGRRPGLAEMRFLMEERGATLGGVMRLSLHVLRTVALLEAAGAAALSLGFWQAGYPAGQAVWWGIFHSVSAFNNAGFDITGVGLVPFRGHWGIVLTVSALIIAGGLGFGVLAELGGLRPRRRLSVHATTVLVMSAILLALGTLLLYGLDRQGLLAGLPESRRWLAAFFHSVSARTAGFNTVDMAGWTPGSLFAIMLLMFVGASPVSTGGGVRTTTAAVALAAIISFGSGWRQVRLGRHQVPEDVLRRALVLLVGAFLLLAAAILALLALEPGLPPLALAFEAVSAFATVGLSTGITAELGALSRAILMVLMLAGKLGVLSVLLLSFGRPESKIQYPPAENLIVG